MPTISPAITVSTTPGLQVDTFMSGLSYQAILNSLGSFLYDVKEFFYNALSVNQFTNPVQYTIYDNNGDIRTRTIVTPVAENQYQPSMYIKQDDMILDGRSGMAFNMLAGEAIQFIFYADRLSVADYIDQAGGVNNYKLIEDEMRNPGFFNNQTLPE